MAKTKTKQQKTKPKKTNPHVKKQGKQADLSVFRAQLDALGLKIIQVTADGNCLFRCFSDQLEGSEEDHEKYRKMVVQYIMKNREHFEPFIEDDIPFEEYCQSMEKDGTWAGHMELHAASLVTHCNVCIHRFMSPRWYIQNFDQHAAHMICEEVIHGNFRIPRVPHLDFLACKMGLQSFKSRSYHDQEHYNSVRLKEDPCDGPARPILIKADADLSATSHQGKAVTGKARRGSAEGRFDTGSIKLVMSGSGCSNAEKVEQVLLQVDGDVDAAIEFLVAEQGAYEQSAENVSLASPADNSYDNQGNNSNCEKVEEDSGRRMNEHDSSNDGIERFHYDSSTQSDDKKIPRNKVCPCGSKKKYKACCGTSKGRSCTNQTIDSRKGRKERKQGKRGPAELVTPSGSDGGPPDVGALCI